MKHLYCKSILFVLALTIMSCGVKAQQSFYMAEHTGQSIHYTIIPKKNHEVKIVKDFLSNMNYILLRNEVRLTPKVEYKGEVYQVTTIDKKAFEEVSSLKEMVITSGITTIDKEAFKNCKKLKKLTMYGVESIADKAFTGCENLNSVVLFTLIPPTMGKEVFDKDCKATLYVPDKALQEYKNSPWADYFTSIYGTSKLGY